MSTARSPIRSIVRADHDHAQPPLAHRRIGHDVDEALDETPVRAVDQLVEVDEALRAGEVAAVERVERDAAHLLGALAHLDEHLDEPRIRVDVDDELRELRDRDGAVGGALEQQVDVQDREQRAEGRGPPASGARAATGSSPRCRGTGGRPRRRRRSPRRRAPRRAPASARTAPWTAVIARWPSSWSCASIWLRSSSIGIATPYSLPMRHSEGGSPLRYHRVTRQYPTPSGRGRTVAANPKEEKSQCGRLGLSTRILALVALAGAVTAVAVGAAGASTSRHSATTITGAGSTFVSPLVAQWISPLGSAYGYELQYSADRIGCRYHLDHLPYRRFRRQRCAADRRSVLGLQRLHPDPVGAWARPRSCTTSPGVPNLLKMDGPTLANIFMGKITTWNDPAIAEAEQGRQAAEHEDLDRAPLGQLGHDLQLHRLPVERQPGLEVADRHRTWP